MLEYPGPHCSRGWPPGGDFFDDLARRGGFLMMVGDCFVFCFCCPRGVVFKLLGARWCFSIFCRPKEGYSKFGGKTGKISGRRCKSLFLPYFPGLPGPTSQNSGTPVPKVINFEGFRAQYHTRCPALPGGKHRCPVFLSGGVEWETPTV